ncbi:MAG: GumC family protein [Thermoanaerobaculia bacterium]
MSKQPELIDQIATVEEAGRETHLSEYWAVIVKRRRLVGLCVGLALAVAAIRSVLSDPIYRATVVLDVEKEKGSPLDISSTPQFYDYYSYEPEFIPTQIRLMKSREVAERVVQRLNLVQNRDLNPQTIGLLRSGAGSESVRQSQEARVRAAAGIQGNIEVLPVRGTNLVELSYIALSPKLAADIANAVAEAYIDWKLEAKFRIVGQASQFLAAQIEQLRSDVDAKEQQLLAYGRQKDIVSTDPQANVTIQKLEAFNKDYAEAMGDRVAKEARYYEVRTARPDAIADTLSSGLMSQLRNESARLEREYAEKLNLFKPEWPAMQQLKAQIDKGRHNLNAVIQETVDKAREVAKSDYLTALRREESLKVVLEAQKSEAMSLKSNAVEYNNLRVEVETRRTLLDTLSKRHSETEMMSRLRGARESNVRIVDRALPPGYRFKPSYKQNGLMALLFGAGLGVGLAFFLEYMDRSLRTAEQVEQYLRLPALGIIPTAGSMSAKWYGYRMPPSQGEKIDAELLPHEQPRSVVAESYRAFRTALLLSRAGGVKSIVITSGFREEGKTCTSVNLAVVLGQLGKRVLLVDADLHAPRLHEILRVSNRVGLVSILAENVEPHQAVLQTPFPGLFVVPAGPVSPNPSGLLSSEAMSKFLEFAGQSFDNVVVDTPPVLAIADSIVLGHLTDGVVICVRGGKTPRDQVARVRDKLLRSNVRILGVLINNVEESAGGYGRPYSYYGYSKERGPQGDMRSAARPALKV